MVVVHPIRFEKIFFSKFVLAHIFHFVFTMVDLSAIVSQNSFVCSQFAFKIGYFVGHSNFSFVFVDFCVLFSQFPVKIGCWIIPSTRLPSSIFVSLSSNLRLRLTSSWLTFSICRFRSEISDAFSCNMFCNFVISFVALNLIDHANLGFFFHLFIVTLYVLNHLI